MVGTSIRRKTHSLASYASSDCGLLSVDYAQKLISTHIEALLSSSPISSP
jgi:hypothetical protein